MLFILLIADIFALLTSCFVFGFYIPFVFFFLFITETLRQGAQAVRQELLQN